MRFPILHKLALGYLFTIILVVLFAVVSFQGLSRFQASVAAADRSQQIIAELSALLAELLAAETSARTYGGTGREDELALFVNARDSLPGHLETIAELVAGAPTQRTRFATLRNLIDTRIAILQAHTDARRNTGAVDPAIAPRAQSRDDINAERTLIETMAAAQNRVLAGQLNASISNQELMTEILLLGGGLLIAIKIGVGYAVTRRLRQGFDALADGADRVGRGELGYRVPVTGNDELSDVATAFNGMAGRVQETNSALDAFAYTVSHDLRAPLRAMQGYSRALLEDYGDGLGDDGKTYANRIVAAAARMDSLIQDLLAYSRLSRSDMALTRIPLALAVEAVMKRMENNLAERGAAIDAAPNLPVVMAHRTTLEQCLHNLFNNAIKFTPPETAPRITVRAEPRDGVTRIWVEDNGIGIAPEHQERIFRVFERLHGAETYPGTGIGLAIVKKGVERMNGDAGVVSSLGAGAKFWFELHTGEAAHDAERLHNPAG